MIKNNRLGGSDWVDGDAATNFTTDFTDTFDATLTYSNNKIGTTGTSGNALPPIGSIVGYHFDWASSNGAIPDGWLDCNGQTISDSDSPMNGTAVPNLNGTTESDKRFLRGNTTSGGTGGNATHSHTWPTVNVDQNPGGGNETYKPGGSAANIPPHFEVKFIIRIK